MDRSGGDQPFLADIVDDKAASEITGAAETCLSDNEYLPNENNTAELEATIKQLTKEAKRAGKKSAKESEKAQLELEVFNPVLLSIRSNMGF